jgi:hypothetical protein
MGRWRGESGEERRGEERVEGERRPIEISRSRLSLIKGEHLFE